MLNHNIELKANAILTTAIYQAINRGQVLLWNGFEPWERLFLHFRLSKGTIKLYSPLTSTIIDARKNCEKIFSVHRLHSRETGQRYLKEMFR